MRTRGFVAMLVIAMAVSLVLSSAAQAASCFGSGYGTNADGTVQSFSTTTNTLTGTLSPSALGSTNVVASAISPDGSKLYLVDGTNNRIIVISTSTFKVTTTIPVGDTPSAIVFSPDGTRAYIANSKAGSITTIDVQADQPLGTSAPLAGLRSPDGLAITPDGLTLYAAVVVPPSNIEVQAFTLAGGLPSATTTPWSLTATEFHGISMAPDGSALYVALTTGTGTGSIEKIVPATGVVTPSWAVLLAEPTALVVSRDSANLYVVALDRSKYSHLWNYALSTPGADPLITTGQLITISSLVTATAGNSIYGAGGTAVSFSTPTNLQISSVFGLRATVDNTLNTVAICPYTVPDAPTGVTGSTGDATVPVSWTAPANTGGLAITGYTVTAAPGGATCTTTGETTCSVPGLTNGTSYSFTVTARNAKGTGASSAASTAIKPFRDNSARALVVGPATFKFTKNSIRITTTVTTTSAGTIAQTAVYKSVHYCNVSRRVAAAGTYQVRCLIKKAGRNLSRRRAVPYSLRSTFSPSNGLLAFTSQPIRIPRHR